MLFFHFSVRDSWGFASCSQFEYLCCIISPQKNCYNSIPLFLAVTVGEKRPIDIKTGKPDAPCKVTSTNPKGRPEDLPTTKTKDGYQAIFAPLEVGPYKVKVEYAGKEIPKSPFSVPVEPKTDLNKVEVKGLETRKLSYVSLNLIVFL